MTTSAIPPSPHAHLFKPAPQVLEVTVTLAIGADAPPLDFIAERVLNAISHVTDELLDVHTRGASWGLRP